MNKQRRLNLSKIIDQCSELSESVGQVRDEEQEYLEEMPDNLQEGEKAQRSEEIIDILTNAEDIINDAISLLEDSIL
jgi:hypothetical protein